VLWRQAEISDYVRAIVNCARIMSRRLGWLVPAEQPTQEE
jgi:hypothetical protein